MTTKNSLEHQYSNLLALQIKILNIVEEVSKNIKELEHTMNEVWSAQSFSSSRFKEMLEKIKNKRKDLEMTKEIIANLNLENSNSIYKSITLIKRQNRNFQLKTSSMIMIMRRII